MQYDLVFEGGGAKGMVFVGALEEFIRRGHTHSRLLGTSAGAITAALLAAGYSPAEMKAILSETDNGHSVFAGFLGDPPPFEAAAIESSVTRSLLQNIDLRLVFNFIEKKFDNWLAESLLTSPRYRHFFSFIERGGWYSAHKFVDWLSRKLDGGLYEGQPRRFSRMSLFEFFEATHTELTVIATDTTDEQMLVLNHRTAPDCPLVWAVRMSMSIPLLWPEVEWQSAWGLYRDSPIDGHQIVDGGLLSNFPLELFISEDEFVTSVMGPKQPGNTVLGFLIDETMPVDSMLQLASLPERVKPLTETQLAQRLMRLVNTTMRAHDKMVIKAFEQYIVRLPAGGYSTTEFNMSKERREALVSVGQKAMRAYLERRTGQMAAATSPALPLQQDLANYADEIALKMLLE